MRLALRACLCAALACAARSATAAVPPPATPMRAGIEQFLVAPWDPGPVLSAPSFAGATLSGFGDSRDSTKVKKGRHAKKVKLREPRPEGMPLGPERARILLRSLTMPGWGQASLGRRHAGAAFAVADLGIWVTFASFRIQEQMRRETYRRTALLGAGIDLTGRDEEFRRIVGAFISSDEYNLFVVARDAANIYLRDLDHPDMDGYRAYIAAHSLGGGDAWNWSSRDAFHRYGAQRKDAQRAAIRANSMLGIAIANRIVSALHAARAAGHVAAPAHSWRFEVAPAPGADATAFRAALSASF
jgi:hypothetical protein